MNFLNIINLYLQGDKNSRQYLEEFIYSDNFWLIILIELKDSINWESEKIQLLLLLLSRRLILFRNEYLSSDNNNIIQDLLQLRFHLNSNILYESISSSLALICLKQPQNLFDTFQYVQQTIIDSPLLTIKFITELASQSTNEDLEILQGIRKYIVDLVLTTITSSSSSDQDKLYAACISCLRIWMNKHIISHIELLNTNQRLIEILANLTTANEMYPLTLLAIADFYDDILLAIANLNGDGTSSIHETKRISVQTGDHSILVTGSDDVFQPLENTQTELLPYFHEILVQYLAQQFDQFETALKTTPDTIHSERITWQHSYIRVLAASLKFLFHNNGNPFNETEFQIKNCSKYDILKVIQQTVIACHHHQISYAVIAMEAINFVHSRMTVDCRRILKENSIFHVVSQECLFHYTHPPSDDSDLDMDTWLMHREQVVGDTFRICYLELRSSLLNEMMITIEREVSYITESSIDIVSGYIYGIKSIGMDLTTRAQLNVSNNNSLFNVSRAGRNYESPDEIRIDSKLTSEFLLNILQGIYSGYSSSNQVMQHHKVVISSIKLIGVIASWLSKGKILNESSGNTDVFDIIGPSIVEYILNGLKNPILFYYSANSLRTICSRCGKQISTYSEIINSLLSHWNVICSNDQSTMRQQLYDSLDEFGNGELDLYSRFDENSDILLEVEKSIVQAICMVLKYIPSESSRYYIEVLLQPPIRILIETGNSFNTLSSSSSSSSSFSSSSNNGNNNNNDNSSYSVKDIIAMITIITIFVRSIRIEQDKRKLSNNYNNSNNNNNNNNNNNQQEQYSLDNIEKIDITIHPALEILTVCNGQLFKSIMLKYPISLIHESISYFFSSLVTFVSPLLPVSQLPHLSQIICLEYLEQIMSLSISGSTNMLKEVFSVIGSIVQYQQSKKILQSTYETYECNDETVFQLQNIFILTVNKFVEYCTNSYNYILNISSDVTSITWNQTIQSLNDNLNAELYESMFNILQSVVDNIPCITSYLLNLFEITQFSLLLLSKRYQNASLSLSVSHYLKSIMMCRRRTIEFYRTYLTNTENDDNLNKFNSTISQTQWETNISTIIQRCRENIILECLLELLSDDISCHEALFEGYVNLLWLCLKDSLENNERFPIEECCSQLYNVFSIRSYNSPFQSNFQQLVSFLIYLCEIDSQNNEFNFTSKEFTQFWSLISNISLQKESINTYTQFINSISENKQNLNEN